MGVKKADPIIDTILVNVCYEQSAAPEHDREEMCRDLLLPYPSMAEHLPEVARRWMELAPTLGAAADVIYISLVRPLPFTETRFLFMAQAVETLHRRLYGGEHIPKAEYRTLNKKLRKALDDAFPDDLAPEARQAIKERLGYANEFTLKDRFLDLLRRLPGDVCAYICNDAQAFAEACKNERNLLTHDPADSVHEPMSDRHGATHTLRWLAVLTILRHLGVPDELLAKRLHETFPTEYTYRQSKKQVRV